MATIIQGNTMVPSVYLTHDGITDSLAGWSRRIGVDCRVLWWRWNKGMAVERILSVEPLKSQTTYLTIDGKTRSLREWCKISGAKPNTVRYRIAAGWPEKKAVFGKSIKGYHQKRGRVRRVRYHGVVDTLIAHCQRLGVEPDTIRMRMRSMRCSFEKAADYEPIRYMVGDRSMASVARESGIGYGTARYRAQALGWSCEEAATQPLVTGHDRVKAEWNTRRRNQRKRELRQMGVMV